MPARQPSGSWPWTSNSTTSRPLSLGTIESCWEDAMRQTSPQMLSPSPSPGPWGQLASKGPEIFVLILGFSFQHASPKKVRAIASPTVRCRDPTYAHISIQCLEKAAKLQTHLIKLVHPSADRTVALIEYHWTTTARTFLTIHHTIIHCIFLREESPRAGRN